MRPETLVEMHCAESRKHGTRFLIGHSHWWDGVVCNGGRRATAECGRELFDNSVSGRERERQRDR